MTANAIGETAKIYQFPKGGRAGLGSGRYQPKPGEHLASTRIARVACGGASYHEAAIREAEAASGN